MLYCSENVYSFIFFIFQLDFTLPFVLCSLSIYFYYPISFYSHSQLIFTIPSLSTLTVINFRSPISFCAHYQFIFTDRFLSSFTIKSFSLSHFSICSPSIKCPSSYLYILTVFLFHLLLLFHSCLLHFFQRQVQNVQLCKGVMEDKSSFNLNSLYLLLYFYHFSYSSPTTVPFSYIFHFYTNKILDYAKVVMEDKSYIHYMSYHRIEEGEGRQDTNTFLRCA